MYVSYILTTITPDEDTRLECRNGGLLTVTFQVIDQTRGRVFHQDIQTPRSVLKNEVVGRVFLTTSRCLDILMKHSSECLI